MSEDEAIGWRERWAQRRTLPRSGLPQDCADWHEEFEATVAPGLARPPAASNVGYPHLKRRA